MHMEWFFKTLEQKNLWRKNLGIADVFFPQKSFGPDSAEGFAGDAVDVFPRVTALNHMDRG